MGHDATEVELESFIEAYADSPLAELAYRRLGAPAASAPVSIARAITTHNAQLTREATSIAIADLSPQLSSADEIRQTTTDSSVADAK
jgi:hypothetical protein